MKYYIRTYVYWLFLLPSLAFLSCQKTLEEEKEYAENKSIESFISKWNYTKVDGVYSVSRIPSYGYQVAKCDSIAFWYQAYTLDGKVFDTNIESVAVANKLDISNRELKPVEVTAANGNLIKGLDIGILQVRENEVATILFSSSLGFGKSTIGPVKQWASLAYDIYLIKVSNPSIRKEKEFINSLNLSNSGFQKDTNDLYYKNLILGTAPSPTINDTIYGWYRGTLPDGTVVDEVGTSNKKVALSTNEVPIGIRLGFTFTKVGGTTRLVVPSFLAYGNDGNDLVSPYQTLFYEIRLDSIK